MTSVTPFSEDVLQSRNFKLRTKEQDIHTPMRMNPKTIEMIQQAFQLAYFIHCDQLTACNVTKRAYSKLSTEIRTQIKRLEYTPKGRPITTFFSRLQSSFAENIFRTKVYLDEAHLLQRLVYIESDRDERKREEATNPYPVDEETLIVHFIKHLSRLAFKNNSFYASLCASRFLHNYSTGQTMEIYSTVLQNPDRVPMEDYYRKRKKKLLDDLKNRFEKFVRIVSIQRGEERIEAKPDSRNFADLVNQCLNQFKPWKTTCCVPPNFERDSPLPELTAQSKNPDAQHEIEIRRIHAVLHYDCYQRLAKGLKLDDPVNRLAIPNFILSNQVNSGNTPSRQGEPPKLDWAAIEEIQEQVEKQAERKKNATARIIHLHADGTRLQSFDASEQDSIKILLPEDAELIELHTNDEEGDLLLATHLLSYDQNGKVEAGKFSFKLASGPELSLAIEPDDHSDLPTLKIQCRTTSSSEFSRISNLISQISAKPAWAVLLLAMGITGFLVRQTHLTQSPAGSIANNSGSVSATLSPEPTEPHRIIALSSKSMTSLPDLRSLSNKDQKTTNSASIAVPAGTSSPPVSGLNLPDATLNSARTSKQVADSPRSGPNALWLFRRNARIGTSIQPQMALAKITALVITVSAPEEKKESFQNSLTATLKKLAVFSLTENESDADAMLKVEIAETERQKAVYKVQLLAEGGVVIWPFDKEPLAFNPPEKQRVKEKSAENKQGRNSTKARDAPYKEYEGEPEEVAQKIATDLLEDLTSAKKK